MAVMGAFKSSEEVLEIRVSLKRKLRLLQILPDFLMANLSSLSQ
ncbi:hypothetical protein CKA32_000254 [Geitlerinema sp. FC II]|nr:hypothetical protein CKA32_000254 [Geitlerinema sp. FC II]